MFSTISNSVRALVSHRYGKPAIALVVLVALAVLIPMCIIHRQKIKSYILDIIENPDRHSIKALILGVMVGALFIGLLFLIKKAVSRIFH